MVRFRVSSASLFALLAIIAPSLAWAQTDSLPSTAYSVSGVANTLATSEDSAISSRLRALRNGDRLTPSKIVASRPPLIYPLQDTDEALHDLRTGKKAPTITSPHGTQNNYRAYSPALYKGDPTPNQPASTMFERTYDETMRLSSIGAGAPNATTRGTNAPVLRNVPNMADRLTTKTLDLAGEVGGQGQTYATAKPGTPRYAMVTPRERDKMAASHYRGQPLSNLAASDQPIAVPTMTAGASVAAQPMPLTSNNGATPYSSAPPVIYGPNDVVPPDMTAPATAAPSAPTKMPPPSFTYRKVDQSNGMTTPRLGSPTSAETSVLIKQSNSYAMASQSNFTGYATPRPATEAGTLLWTAEDKAQAQERNDDKTPLLAQTPDDDQRETAPSYGTRAVPLAGVNIDRRWGFFMTGNTGFGSDKLQTGADKTKTVTSGFTTGLDYRLKDKSFVGMALTYAHSSFTTGNTADLQGNSVSLSLYGTSDYATDAYVDSYISVGYHNLDSERGILANTTKATGSLDGFQFASKTETGYNIKNAGMSYGPFAAFRFAYSDFGSFTESGANAYNLKVGSQDNVSAIGSVGVGGTHRIALSNGGVLLPGLRMAYNHEFGDDRSNIKAQFANLSASSFTTKSDKKSRDWLGLSPSVAASLPNDWTLLAQYEHDFFRDDSNENLFNLSAHYKW